MFSQFGDNLAQIKFQHFIKIVCTPVAQKSNFELCLIFKIKSLEKIGEKIGEKKDITDRRRGKDVNRWSW